MALRILFALCMIYGTLSKPVSKQAVQDERESCDSLVYCRGQLLDIVQNAGIFTDSKTFVDLSQKHPQQQTLRNFEELLNRTNRKPTRDEIKQFVNDNFEDSNELEDWTPPDFKENPKFLDKVKNKDIRHFAKDLVAIWATLGRKIKSSVFEHPDQHSLIGVPNGIIIPGGRFKEFYYWDSYWIVDGLIISEMVDTARGIVENLLSMVERFGFVPNGGRKYYLNRSQPPLLTVMVESIYKTTKDVEWLNKHIGTLETELNYWLDKKTEVIEKDGVKYQLAHYISQSVTPRPESYREDVNTCAYFSDKAGKEHCFQGLKSGAESGIDFSSRWLFDEHGGDKANLSHIDAQRIIPVDLNAFLCKNFELLSEFHIVLGNPEKAAAWKEKSETWKKSIQLVLYDRDDGIWYDYDPVLQKSRKMFYPTNFAPLWAGAYDIKIKNEYGKRAAAYFEKMRIGEFKGGIPSSLENSNEQWDLPNAWAPEQELVIIGLWNTGHSKAKRLAKQSAQNWVESTFRGFQETHAMFEKYDATRVGQYGGGGEYEVQTGFGWTNGLCIKLINMYYTCDSCKSSKESKEKSGSGSSKSSDSDSSNSSDSDSSHSSRSSSDENDTSSSSSSSSDESGSKRHK